MKFTRKSVNDALAKAARTESPPIDPVFANQLEKRLKSLDLSIPTVTLARTLRRSVPRGIAIGIVAAGVTGVAAAAMAVVITHNKNENRLVVASTPDTHEPSPTTSTIADVTSTTESASTTSSIPFATTSGDASTPITVAPTMAPPPIVTVAPTTAPPTTVPVTVAPTTTVKTAPPTITTSPTTTALPPATTAPPPAPTTTTTLQPTTTTHSEPTTTSSAPSTTTTEVHTPATMSLSCGLVAGGVQCMWSSGPPGTDHYVVLKTSPGLQGRVLTPAPGATTIVDTDVTAGRTYTYLVHADDASNASIAHSNESVATCCQ